MYVCKHTLACPSGSFREGERHNLMNVSPELRKQWLADGIFVKVSLDDLDEDDMPKSKKSGKGNNTEEK